MPPSYKTCSTIWQRQGLDTGHGRIFVPSSFGGGNDNTSNDSCGAVNVHDCPTGYKLLYSSHSPKKGYVNDNVMLTGVDLNRHKCWEGGHYNTDPIHGTGGQAPWGTNHGLNHTYASNSVDSGFGDEDNYGRPCFKDTHGWGRTNPENGNKSSPNTEDNKNACCGFKDTARGKVKEKYCDPSYCFQRGSDKYSVANPDKISKKCSEHLLEKCRNWSFITDLIGFEDDRCSDPISQISKDFNKHREDLSDFALSKGNDYSASIKRADYADIGKDLCTVDDFLNSKSSDDIKKKKSEKCIRWCKDNGEACSERMKGVCQTVYDRVQKYPDIFPDDLKEYEGICACNWPQEFYDNIVEYYKKTYNVSAAAIGTRRKCLFRPCGSSSIKHYDPTASDHVCDVTNFTSCIQNLNIDFTGSQIEGEVNVDAAQSQACGTIADSGAGADSGASGGVPKAMGGEGSSPSDEDDSSFMVSIIIIILGFIILIAGGGIMLI